MNDEAGNFARDDHCIVVGVISQAEIALVKGDWYVGPPYSLVWASDPNVMYPSIVLSFLLLDFWFKGGAPMIGNMWLACGTVLFMGCTLVTSSVLGCSLGGGDSAGYTGGAGNCCCGCWCRCICCWFKG